MLPIQVTGTSRRYNIRKCNYKKNASISKNISIFLKFSPKITILYKVSPKQSNYDRERKEETGNVRTRYAESWKKREINEEGTLKPFSKEELEHIFMLNDHLKELTSSTIDKTLRVSRHLLDEIEKGYKDFEDYQIESYIGMTYLDDGDETLEEQE